MYIIYIVVFKRDAKDTTFKLQCLKQTGNAMATTEKQTKDKQQYIIQNIGN